MAEEKPVTLHGMMTDETKVRKDAYLNYTILKPAYVLSIKKFKSKFSNKREMFITINDYVNDLDTLDEDLMDNVKYYCINVKELLEKIAEKINQKYSQKIKLVLPEAPDLMLTANERKHGLYNSYKDIEQSLASSTIRFTRESYGKLSESNLRIGSDGSIDLVFQDMELESKVNMYGYGSYGITKLRELIFSDTVLDDIFSMLDEVEARTDSVVMLKDFLETKEVVEQKLAKKVDTIYEPFHNQIEYDETNDRYTKRAASFILLSIMYFRIVDLEEGRTE